MHFCTVCNTHVGNKQWNGHLRSNKHKNNCVAPFFENVEILESAFRGRIASYRILGNSEEALLPELFLNNVRTKVKLLIDCSLNKHTSVKVNFELFSRFLLPKNESQETKSFCTKNHVLCFNYKFDTFFDEVVKSLVTKVEEFQERDSGWSFLYNCYLEVNINKFQPLSGSNYIELPKSIKSRKACINIKNKDNYCFLWAVTAGLYPTTRHPQRLSSYPHFRDVLNCKDLSFPISFSDIAIFEKNNRDLCVNVYGLKKDMITGPLYKSETNNKHAKRVNLLLLENSTSSHYCLIKNLTRLVRSQITKHHGKIFFCDDCLQFFSTFDKLDKHLCAGVVTHLPNEGSFIEFKNYHRKQDIPYVIYADFETILQPFVNIEPCNNTNTLKLQQHIPAAFSYNIVSSVNEHFNRFKLYRGEDCVSKFIEMLYKDVEDIVELLNQNKTLIFTENDAYNFRNAIRCHICEQLLWGKRVRDHCHLTGRFRGAAHWHCNLQYKIPKFIPIFFHNLSGYDCHLFIKELGERPGKITIIAKTKENYTSFTKFLSISNEIIQLRFLDSFNFLSASLDKLSKIMKKDDFVSLLLHYPNEDKFNLLTRKGVYPYNYITDWACYEETMLPARDSFYNSLTDDNISSEDYKHARTVWKKFKINNLGEYTDLYLKTDVLLLTDIFQSFRRTCKQHYKLDPAFYITAPSLSFDAMLLKTGVQLELISELEIIRMIQKGIRGGLCVCSHRYAQANNRYMSNYDESRPETYIVYIDCNNLYGYSMCQYLPFSGFRFLTQCEINELDVYNIPDNAQWGFIFEVDLFYPDYLHSEHNDLPFCSEKCIPTGGKTSKLVPNLYNKYNYVIHYIHLKKCLEHGLLLRKIHKAITFKQGTYLKKYIELNTELRQKSESAFEQDFFKLLNNSVFGKTLENTEKRVDVKLVNQWLDKENKTNKSLQAQKLIANPYFHSVSVFTENLVAIQMKPDKIILDKPIYIGFTVLELSKSHMYHFHYNIIKPFYKENVKLCYSDTDSFLYLLSTKDFYRDIKETFQSYFDTSNYSTNNTWNLPLVNKKIPGLFKDEMAGNIISDFIGLRSKLYCIKTCDQVIKKAKGAKSSVVRNLSVSDYENVLLSNEVIKRKNILFKSIKHQIFTQSVNKIVLSNKDDKRFICSNKISTLAWGNAAIFKNVNKNNLDD